MMDCNKQYIVNSLCLLRQRLDNLIDREIWRVLNAEYEYDCEKLAEELKNVIDSSSAMDKKVLE